MSATMIGVAPYAGLKFMTYEGFKTVLSKWKGVDERDLPGTPLIRRLTTGAESTQRCSAM